MGTAQTDVGPYVALLLPSGLHNPPSLQKQAIKVARVGPSRRGFLKGWQNGCLVGEVLQVLTFTLGTGPGLEAQSHFQLPSPWESRVSRELTHGRDWVSCGLTARPHGTGGFLADGSLIAQPSHSQLSMNCWPQDGAMGNTRLVLITTLRPS